jgi:catechol 2,3-dioxygenase-like lactoylglutathione lyase family enzyme
VILYHPGDVMSTILQSHYVLAVHDVRRSAEFYVRMLGFRIVAEPDGWIFVAKDGCMIMLGADLVL